MPVGQLGAIAGNSWTGIQACNLGTLSHSCLKVHATVPIALIIFFRPSGVKDQLPGH